MNNPTNERAQGRVQSSSHGALDGFHSGDSDVRQKSSAKRDAPQSFPEAMDASNAEEREPVETEVTTTLDLLDNLDGEISLRKALRDARDGDAITFAPSLKGKTISVNSKLGEFVVDKAIKIDALSSAPGIVLDGQGSARVLRIENCKNVEIAGLVVCNGCSESDGGGVVAKQCQATFKNCKIQKNRNNGKYGGGLYVDESELKFVNCAVTDNESTKAGGGLFVYRKGKITLVNCTITNNSCNSYGCGLFQQSGELAVYNSIICGNKSERAESDVYVSSGDNCAPKGRNVLSTYAAWSEGFDNQSPAPSSQLFVNAETGDYRLVPNSQAIDKGNNEYVDSTIDLERNERVVNGRVDLGAYELQESTSTSE